MEISGYIRALLGVAYETQGVLSMVVDQSSGAAVNSGAYTSLMKISFKASNNWTGNTSENGGDTSKPATVAIMWILRFI